MDRDYEISAQCEFVYVQGFPNINEYVVLQGVKNSPFRFYAEIYGNICIEIYVYTDCMFKFLRYLGKNE